MVFYVHSAPSKCNPRLAPSFATRAIGRADERTGTRVGDDGRPTKAEA